MHSKFYEREDLDQFPDDSIVIDQKPKSKIETRFQHIKTEELGLSKSRNLALKHSSPDKEFLIFADDDFRFVKNYKELIDRTINQIGNADVIVFPCTTEQGKLRRAYKLGDELSFSKCLGLCSAELMYKKSFLLEHKLSFNTKFGLGATYPSGEEAILVSELRKKGGKILSTDQPLVIHPEETSGDQHQSKSQVQTKAAVLREIFKHYYIFAAIAYSIAKYPLYKKHFSLFQFFKFMIIK